MGIGVSVRFRLDRERAGPGGGEHEYDELGEGADDRRVRHVHGGDDGELVFEFVSERYVLFDGTGGPVAELRGAVFEQLVQLACVRGRGARRELCSDLYGGEHERVATIYGVVQRAFGEDRGDVVEHHLEYRAAAV